MATLIEKDDKSNNWKGKYIPEGDTKIRRYRSFDYFESILRRKRLWFTRADRFQDNFEGTLTKIAKDYIDSWEGTFDDIEGMRDMKTALMDRARRARFQCYINCWRIVRRENPLIWNAYLRGNPGVAIETTVDALLKETDRKRDYHFGEVRHPLTISNEDLEIRWRRVRYLDYTNQPIPNLLFDAIEPLLHKRNAFWQENEFRVVVPDDMSNVVDANPESDTWYDLDQLERENPANIHCSVNINDLIDNIIVAPGCSDDFHHKVEKTAENYLSDPTISKSELEQEDPYI